MSLTTAQAGTPAQPRRQAPGPDPLPGLTPDEAEESRATACRIGDQVANLLEFTPPDSRQAVLTLLAREFTRGANQVAGAGPALVLVERG